MISGVRCVQKCGVFHEDSPGARRRHKRFYSSLPPLYSRLFQAVWSGDGVKFPCIRGENASAVVLHCVED